MSTLTHVSKAAYVEITEALGGSRIVSLAAYIHLPIEALAGTRARVLTRGELIARHAARRRAT